MLTMHMILFFFFENFISHGEGVLLLVCFHSLNQIKQMLFSYIKDCCLSGFVS